VQEGFNEGGHFFNIEWLKLMGGRRLGPETLLFNIIIIIIFIFIFIIIVIIMIKRD